MSDQSCNYRGHFSWLMKSCFPNPNDKPLPDSHIPLHLHLHRQRHRQGLRLTSAASSDAATTGMDSLSDDLLLECLSRVPPPSLPSVSLVCRRWSHLVESSAFSGFRRLRGLLRPTVFALSSSADSSCLLAASLCFDSDPTAWRVSLFLASDAVSLANLYSLVSHSRLSAIGPRIYIIGRSSMVCYDTWTGTVTTRSPMASPRKKFASAACSGKIYVAGGGGCGGSSSVDEYDPRSDTWRVVSQAPRRRYGCVGAAVDGVFYVIGGLRIGSSVSDHKPPLSAVGVGAEAHVYASSMDLYDVETRAWLRSRSLPGGGCVVAACAASVGHVYILASHAVELSFWRFDGRRKTAGFGEWERLKAPPLPAQVRLDSSVRFSCVGAAERVVLVQVAGCIDDLLRRSGRAERGLREGLVLVYDTAKGEWNRGADLPEVIRRAACVSVEC
ncbi:hypothetical protein SAY86_024147 [Trapa natans]|uniref:F-box domain-containing protein n=1 Tax=Trapa natans TaxID=22666 RepID=A0AAN7R8J8_TRANT|nr:hypothetical protein SAY86_024147 [Trapa natans]